MQKIKSFIESDRGKDVLVVLVVILVGLGSFELGRLSKGTNGSSGIQIEYTGPDMSRSVDQSANVLSATESKETVQKQNSSDKNFFASNRGSKYYPVGCSAGKNIVQENRVYFGTSGEAEAAGYELSSSCR